MPAWVPSPRIALSEGSRSSQGLQSSSPSKLFAYLHSWAFLSEVLGSSAKASWWVQEGETLKTPLPTDSVPRTSPLPVLPITPILSQSPEACVGSLNSETTSPHVHTFNLTFNWCTFPWERVGGMDQGKLVFSLVLDSGLHHHGKW